MKKILVLRGGALGDFIVTLPALALLRENFPAARLELSGHTTAAQLALGCGLLDDAHSQHEARWAALHSHSPLPPEFAAWLADFDLVVNFWPDPDRALREKFPLRAGQIFLHGEALPALAPAAAHYCEPLRALGLAPGKFHFLLRPPTPAPRRIAIHPGSGSAQKNWPLARWRTAAEALTREHGAELLIISGEAEPPAVLAGCGRPLSNLPLPVLADELARCRLFLGHDSGVSHLAAACGVPCVLLFGPTDPAVWAPPAPDVRVLRWGATVAEIPVAAVLAAADAVLSRLINAP